MHCFTLRTKSPPVSSPSSSTVDRSSPLTQPATSGVEPGIGLAGLGEAAVALRQHEVAPDPLDGAGPFGDLRARPVGGRLDRVGVGTPPLVGEARHERGHLGRVQRRRAAPRAATRRRRGRSRCRAGRGARPRGSASTPRRSPTTRAPRARGRAGGRGSRCGPRPGVPGGRCRARAVPRPRPTAAPCTRSGAFASGCSASARSRSATRSAVASERSSSASGSSSRRSASAATRWKRWSWGRNGRGSSMVASRRARSRKSSGPRRTRSRPSVSASTRLPPRPRSCFNTTTRPPRRGADTTSPGRSASSRAGRAAAAARFATSRSSLMARYSSTSPRSLRRARLLPGQQLTVVGEEPLERHDVAIGVVLREREVEEMARLVGRISPHEVDGHVVGRAERRRQRVRAAAREPGDLVEGDERVPEHDHEPDLVDARAAPPAPRAACTPLASGTRGARP